MIKLIIILSFLLIPTKQAHAIIILPALILIPIAKVVAIILGALGFPALGLSVAWHKIFGSKISKVLGIVIFGLILIGLSIAIYLKIENPDRPLF